MSGAHFSQVLVRPARLFPGGQLSARNRPQAPMKLFTKTLAFLVNPVCDCAEMGATQIERYLRTNGCGLDESAGIAATLLSSGDVLHWLYFFL
jgi:hypothetical protein